MACECRVIFVIFHIGFCIFLALDVVGGFYFNLMSDLPHRVSNRNGEMQPLWRGVLTSANKSRKLSLLCGRVDVR